MMLLWAVILVLLMMVWSVGPGLLIARRLRFSSPETFALSIGISFLVVYLIATAFYLLQIPWSLSWLVTLGAFATLWITRNDLTALWRRRQIRQQVWAFCFLLFFSLLAIATIRHFSGGTWAGDWLEHHQRTIFFLDHLPDSMLFLSVYPLPARPPMMNLVAAWFLGHGGGGEFGLFHVVFVYLNVLSFFACVLLAGQLIRFGGRSAWAIAAMLALSPFVMQNITYTWTKLLCAFYVVLSLSLYLRAWQRNDSTRLFAAAAMVAAGMLVHYSAGPFAVMLGLHYLITLPKRRRRAMEILGSLAIAGGLLFTWFGWSIARFGTSGTFASNTSVTDAARLSAVENIAKIGRNVFHTFVPHPLRMPFDEFRYGFDQPNPFGAVRDYLSLIHHANIAFAFGTAGWTALLYLVARQWRTANARLRLFWAIFAAAGSLLAIAVTGAVEQYGLAPVVLQPIVLIGLTMLAAGLKTLPPWARAGVLAAVAIDFAAVTLLQVRMQMHDFALSPPGVDSSMQAVPYSSGLLSVLAVWNSVLRHRMGNVFLADALGPSATLAYALLILLAAVAIVRIAFAWRVRRGGVALGAAILILGSAVVSADRWLGFSSSAPAGQATDPELLRAAVQRDPASASARYRLGRAEYALRRLEPAEAMLTDAMLLDPFALEPRYLLRMLLLTHGRFLEQTDAWAAEVYRRTPENPEAARARTEKLRQRGLPVTSP